MREASNLGARLSSATLFFPRNYSIFCRFNFKNMKQIIYTIKINKLFILHWVNENEINYSTSLLRLNY